VKYCDTCRTSYPSDFVACPKDKSALRPVTDLMPGLVLRGKYEILEKLGAGGMGAVYKARHTAFGELRALKVIGTHLVGDEDYLARFKSEAVLSRKLDHPNVVRVEDFDVTEDGRPFIVMEYVEGESLRGVIRREGALDVGRAAEIARQACEGLSAAHALGILHRDIKPDNILLVPGPDGLDQVKLLDFGLAKVVEGFDGAGVQVATRTGLLIGTPQYLAPEQALGAKGVRLDGRLDLYALGIVLYEMLTGRVPFDSDTPMGIVMHHLQTQPVPPHQASPQAGIPGSMSAIVLQALEKSPERRYASAQEMGEALRAAAQAPRTLVPRATVPPPAARPRPVSTGARTAPRLESRRAERAALRTPAPIEDEPPARPVWPWVVLAAGVAAAGFLWSRPPSPAATPSPGIDAQAPARVPGPQPAQAEARPQPGDDAIRNEAERLLFFSAALRDARIVVAVANGIVTLTGEAPSATAKDLATSLAASVPGVVRVFNVIQVSAAPAPAPALAEATAAPAPSEAPPPAPPGPPPGDSEPVRILLERARAEIQAGRHEEAARLFEEVLRHDPGHPIAREALERFRHRRPPPH